MHTVNILLWNRIMLPTMLEGGFDDDDDDDDDEDESYHPYTQAQNLAFAYR